MVAATVCKILVRLGAVRFWTVAPIPRRILSRSANLDQLARQVKSVIGAKVVRCYATECSSLKHQ